MNDDSDGAECDRCSLGSASGGACEDRISVGSTVADGLVLLARRPPRARDDFDAGVGVLGTADADARSPVGGADGDALPEGVEDDGPGVRGGLVERVAVGWASSPFSSVVDGKSGSELDRLWRRERGARFAGVGIRGRVGLGIAWEAASSSEGLEAVSSSAVEPLPFDERDEGATSD